MNVCEAAEAALVELLTPVVATALDVAEAEAPVYPGKNDATKDLPAVICRATRGEEYPRGTGNFWLTLEVELRHPARDESKQLTVNAAVLEALRTVLQADDLDAQITSAAEDFHVFAGSLSREADGRDFIEDDALWVDSIQMRCLACASDLA
jgi:hypothetical protein